MHNFPDILLEFRVLKCIAIYMKILIIVAVRWCASVFPVRHCISIIPGKTNIKLFFKSLIIIHMPLKELK